MEQEPSEPEVSLRAYETPHSFEIESSGYRLKIDRQQPAMELWLGGRPVTKLNPASALDTTDAFDDTTVLDPPVMQWSGPGRVVISWTGRSTRWDRKEVQLQAWPGGFSYRFSVDGYGAIDRAYYWRNRLAGSDGSAVRLFNPEPNSRGVNYTGQRCWSVGDCTVCNPEPSAAASYPPDFMTISVGRDKTYHAGNWLFTPAPFCYALAGESNWLSLGIAAQPGQWNFSDYCYPGDGFGFSLIYDGHTHVKGRWHSPTMVCLVASDEYSAIESYCRFLRQGGMSPAAGRRQPCRWWLEPIFCGWGEQVSQQVDQGGPTAQQRATQANYQHWMAELDRHDLKPGTIVIDDKWQLNYGLNEPDPAKWPDMAGFIAQQHLRQRRVLLWLKAWDPQGLPPGECISGPDGLPLAADPTQPDWRARLSAQVHYMLNYLDADGFKVDFTHLIPRGPTLEHQAARQARGSYSRPASHPPLGVTAAGKWGLELLREWLLILANAAFAAKPEAMIITHTANPYLADLVDVLRLNDVACLELHSASITPDMTHRARIARSASPFWLLDADNWPCSSRGQWRDYIEAQSSGNFGVPALYHIQRFGWGKVNEALQEEDFAAVRECWRVYRAALPAPSAII